MDDLPIRLATLAEDHLRGRIGRREFLRRAMAFGLSLSAAGAFLAACQAAATPSAAPASGTAAPTTAPSATAAPSVSAAPTAAPSAAGSGLLTIRSTIPYRILDTADIATGMDVEAIYPVLEPLIAYKNTGTEIINVLAETWTPAADGASIAFTLKKGIKFHGGFGEVTADDVKHSYERAAGLTAFKGKSGWGPYWAPLKGVEVKDTYSGTILLKHPSPGFVADMMLSYCGSITSKKALEQMGDDKFALQPIGTGPYQIDSIDPAVQVVLKRFGDWSGASRPTLDGDPYYDQIVGKVVSDEAAVQVALQTGELDFARFDNPDNADKFKTNADFVIAVAASTWVRFLAMNITSPKLKDINVRQAIRYAVDVPSVIDAALGGRDRTPQARNLISPVQIPWDGGKYERDVAKAKDYLAKAGVTSLELTMASHDYDKEMAEVIQANLAEVGIKVDINQLDGASFSAFVASDKDEISLHAWTTFGDPAGNTGYLRCDDVGKINPWHICNPTYDEMQTQQASEMDATKRAAILTKMLDFIDQQVLSVWVSHPTLFYVTKKSIKPVLSKLFADARYQDFRPA